MFSIHKRISIRKISWKNVIRKQKLVEIKIGKLKGAKWIPFKNIKIHLIKNIEKKIQISVLSFLFIF